MNTPLLAADESHGVPSLSGGADDPDANSQLTRMLREASSPPLNVPLFRNTNRGPVATTDRRRRPLAPVSFLTVLLGSLTIFLIGLLWGSFLSPSWLEVHLLVTHVFFTPPLDTVLQILDLGSMVSTFVSTGQTSAVVLLAVTTVMIPCCTMIALPMTVLDRHTAVVLGTTYEAKSAISPFIRFGFLIVYIVLILDFVLSAIELTLVETKAEVQTRMGGGLVCYTIGMTMAIVCAKLLAIATVSRPSTAGPVEPMEGGYMRVLEEEDDELGGEASLRETERNSVLSPTPESVCGCSNKLLLFESAVLSIIFWIAAFALPLFKVTYQGAVSSVLSQTTLEVRLANLVQTPQGAAHSILQATVLTQLFAFPLMALAFGIGICFFGFKKRWLAGVHPAVNSFSMCAAVLIIIPILQSLGVEILNEHTSGICSEFHELTGESCLIMVGSVEAGTWCLVGHAVALETFILLSLRRPSTD